MATKKDEKDVLAEAPEFQSMRELLDYVKSKKIENPATLAQLMDHLVDRK